MITFDGFALTLKKETLYANDGYTDKIFLKFQQQLYSKVDANFYERYTVTTNRYKTRTTFLQPFDISIVAAESYVYNFQQYMNDYQPSKCEAKVKGYPPNFRNLQTEQQQTIVEEEKTLPLQRRIFYICSNLGGLYAILVLVLGVIFTPIISKFSKLKMIQHFKNRKFEKEVSKENYER